MNKEPTYFTEGTYTLTSDVTNPLGDKRCKHEWTRRMVWKKGTQFQIGDKELPVYGYNEAGEFDVVDHKTVKQFGIARDGGSFLELSMEDERTQAILPWLVREVETVETVFNRCGFYSNMAMEVLQRAVDAGALTLKDVEELAQQAYDAL